MHLLQQHCNRGAGFQLERALQFKHGVMRLSFRWIVSPGGLQIAVDCVADRPSALIEVGGRATNLHLFW